MCARECATVWLTLRPEGLLLASQQAASKNTAGCKAAQRGPFVCRWVLHPAVQHHLGVQCTLKGCLRHTGCVAQQWHLARSFAVLSNYPIGGALACTHSSALCAGSTTYAGGFHQQWHRMRGIYGIKHCVRYTSGKRGPHWHLSRVTQTGTCPCPGAGCLCWENGHVPVCVT